MDEREDTQRDIEQGREPEGSQGILQDDPRAEERIGPPGRIEAMGEIIYPAGIYTVTTLEEYKARFWGKVSGDRPEECWEWLAGKNSKNYGYFWINGKSVQTHQLAYNWLVGPVPDGLELDHLCRNTICCNVNHLEPVLRLENQRRSPLTLAGKNIIKTHCPKGHPYAGDNLLITTNGGRACKKCISERATAKYWEKKAKRIFVRKDMKREACPLGHPYSGDNLYVDPRGHRHCRACSVVSRIAMKERSPNYHRDWYRRNKTNKTEEI